jgi:magnesium transporter
MRRMMRVRVYDPAGSHLSGGEELLGKPGITWVDVLEPTDEVLTRLGARYGLHRLAIEDCLHLDQRPKLEEYPGHQFMVLQGFSCATENLDDLTLHEMHYFLGPDWLITVHAEGHSAVEEAHRRLDADAANTLGRGPDFVAYLITDALVDRNFPMLEVFSDALEQLEEDVFRQPDPGQLKRAFALKHGLLTVRRVLSPQRDVLALLAKRGTLNVNERTALYFRDIYDHLIRLVEQIESARDLLSGVVDGYLSVMANRTNDVTKQLTIFATIFLPLSFVVGFFGQNFAPLQGDGFFAVMIATVVLMPLGMVLWFRKKGWL